MCRLSLFELFASCCPLFFAWSLLFVLCCFGSSRFDVRCLSIVGCWLLLFVIVISSLFVARCLLLVVCCLVVVDCRVPFVVCRQSSAVWWMMFVVGCV